MKNSQATSEKNHLVDGRNRSVNNMRTVKFYLLILQKLKEQAMKEGKHWFLSTEPTGHSGLTIGKRCVIFKGRLARVSKETENKWKT